MSTNLATLTYVLAWLGASGCNDGDCAQSGDDGGTGTDATDGSESGSSGDGDSEGWTKTYDAPNSDYDAAYGVTVDEQGDVFIVGVTTDTLANGARNMLLQKYRGTDGELLWSNTWDGASGGDDYAFGVAVGELGDLFVVGGTTPDDDVRDIFVGRFSPDDGANLWTESQDGAANDQDNGTGIATGADGSVVIAGRWTDLPGAGGVNGVVRKYDMNGGIVWTRTHDGPAQDFDGFTDVVVTPSAIYCIGTETTAMAGTDARVIAYDQDGELLWTDNYDGGLDDDGAGIALGVDGVLVTGLKTRPDAGTDVWLGSYDSDGALLWTTTATDAASLVSHGVTMDGLGNVWLTGLSAISEGAEDIWTSSFQPDGQPIDTDIHDGPAGSTDIGSEVTSALDGTAVFVAGQETSSAEDGGVNAWIRKIIL